MLVGPIQGSYSAAVEWTPEERAGTARDISNLSLTAVPLTRPSPQPKEPKESKKAAATPAAGKKGGEGEGEGDAAKTPKVPLVRVEAKSLEVRRWRGGGGGPLAC